MRFRDQIRGGSSIPHLTVSNTTKSVLLRLSISEDGENAMKKVHYTTSSWLWWRRILVCRHCSITEASPHKRWLKCDTNISPMKLITHLLHQMVHHRTTLRGSWQWSATIVRITTNTHTTILTTKRGVIRVLRHTELPAGDPIHRQGWVLDGTSTQRLREWSLDFPL